VQFCRPWPERDGGRDRIREALGDRPGPDADSETKRAYRNARNELRGNLVAGLQRLVAEFLVGSGVPEGWVVGLDAFTRLMAYQAIKSAMGEELVALHDGGDAHQLAHLATGAIMVTRDTTFLRRLDSIGTHLAPYACTDAQILYAPPFGLPNDPRARENTAGFSRLGKKKAKGNPDAQADEDVAQGRRRAPRAREGPRQRYG
jgi:hypothetical protein